MKRIVFVLCMLVFLGISILAAQAAVIVDVAEDTYADHWAAETDVMGVLNADWVIQGIYEPGRTRLGVLKFDLPSVIGPSAKLRLLVDSVWGDAGSSWYHVKSLSNAWDENTTTRVSNWPLVLPTWADGNPLDTKEITLASAGTTIEYDVTSAVLAAGAGGTVSFYIAIDHYQPMVSNAWSFMTKEQDPTYTNTAKLVLVPEPGSFAALSAGLVGLCGLIRRRR